MDLQDVKRYVSLGEGLHVEFKRRMPRPERIAKEVVALANAQGGHLFLGVDDDGTIVGLRDVLEEEFALLEALSAHVDPAVEVRLARVPVTPRREVLVVDVPASPDKPHYVIGNGAASEGDGVAYVRVGASSVEASREAVRLMKHERAPRDVRFEFGEKERKLMTYLDRHERITVDGFAQLAGIPRRSASQTLVLLAKANVLRLHWEQGDDYFTLAYNAA
jgi:predicted HTH transcriptional regulator